MTVKIYSNAMWKNALGVLLFSRSIKTLPEHLKCLFCTYRDDLTMIKELVFTNRFCLETNNLLEKVITRRQRLLLERKELHQIMYLMISLTIWLHTSTLAFVFTLLEPFITCTFVGTKCVLTFSKHAFLFTIFLAFINIYKKNKQTYISSSYSALIFKTIVRTSDILLFSLPKFW